MISTFDLALLGSLVSAGGLLFLRQGKSAATAGSRWLTVGALTLLLAYAHGEEEGYLLGPWSDLMFHVVFVSTCWVATSFRVRQTAGEREHVRTEAKRLFDCRT